MIELRHMDVHHLVIIECSHLANGCTIEWGCIGLMLFCYLSCLGAIICDINTCMQHRWCFCGNLCNHSLDVHGPKWTSYVKRPGDVAQWYTISAATRLYSVESAVFNGGQILYVCRLHVPLQRFILLSDICLETTHSFTRQNLQRWGISLPLSGQAINISLLLSLRHRTDIKLIQ